MKCENCGKNYAVIHYRGIVNGRAQEAHLCVNCAAALGRGAEDPFGALAALLTEEAPQPEIPPEAAAPLLTEEERAVLRAERERNALHMQLTQALAAEDYERAAEVRDALKRLDEQRSESI